MVENISQSKVTISKKQETLVLVPTYGVLKLLLEALPLGPERGAASGHETCAVT